MLLLEQTADIRMGEPLPLRALPHHLNGRLGNLLGLFRGVVCSGADTVHCTYKVPVTRDEADTSPRGLWHIAVLATAKDSDTTLDTKAAELSLPLADTASAPVTGCGDRIRQTMGASVEVQMWDALVKVAKDAYAAGLGEGSVPRPLIMPLVGGELVGMIWARPLKVGEDALTGIAQLSNIAAAARADEVVLTWETRDVATACELPIVSPAPCLNMVLATPDQHVLHRFPYTEQLLSRSPEGWASVAPDWLPSPAPQPGAELVPPIQAAVNYAFIPIELNHPDPFGVTVVLMEEDGYRVRLTEAFTR